MGDDVAVGKDKSKSMYLQKEVRPGTFLCEDVQEP